MTAATGMVAVIGAVLTIASMVFLFCRVRRLPVNRHAEVSGLKISVVIPARNEEDNLSRLLSSLSRQSLTPHEVIVVDDQSTDATAEVATRHGARVIAGKELPAGWYGKPWACQQGAEASSGNWLLFLDADLDFEGHALAGLSGVAEAEPGAVFSVCPWHRIERAYEELSVFFNLLMLGGIGAFTWQGERARKIGLFGQTMMISRDRYVELGGHGAVRKRVLENFHLSQKCENLGIPRRCFSGRGSISMRMFPGGFREMVESWAKGFSSGAVLTAPVVLAISSLWLTGMMMITVCLCLLLLGGDWEWVLAAYLAVALPSVFLFRQAGRFSPLNALLFPISLWFYQGVFAMAVIRKRKKTPTQWKGRDVD